MRNVFKSSVPKIQKGRDCLEDLATYEREKKKTDVKKFKCEFVDWSNVWLGLRFYWPPGMNTVMNLCIP
jgi:hypothetical protein